MQIDYQLKTQELEKERKFIEEYCFYDRESEKDAPEQTVTTAK